MAWNAAGWGLADGRGRAGDALGAWLGSLGPLLATEHPREVPGLLQLPQNWVATPAVVAREGF